MRILPPFGGAIEAVSSTEHLAPGQAALRSAGWVAARDSFTAALAADPTPEAYDGLGIARWWLNEVRAAHEARISAYLGFKARGDVGRAARIAAWLAREQVFLDTNGSAMNGWFARAEQLLAQAGPCVERAWVQIYRASMVAPAEELATVATAALASAREFE
jgi:hypothetical protein